MEHACVELHGLTKNPTLNSSRGIVTGAKQANGRFAVLLMDGSTVNVKKTNMCVVFCLGLPREYHIVVGHTDFEEAFVAALEQTDLSKFYVLHAGFSAELGHFFFKVRLPFFAMAMDQIVKTGREPLLRIYACSVSVNEPGAKIKFMDSLEDRLPNSGVVDLTPEDTIRLASIKSNSMEENTTSESQRVETLNNIDIAEVIFRKN